MNNLLSFLAKIESVEGVSITENGYWLWLPAGSSRLATGAEILAAEKSMKIAELEKSCESHIAAGFISSALGSSYTYGSSQQDQTNILGAKVAGIDMLFTCADANGVKAQRMHTAAQLAQVYVDGMVFLQIAYATLDTRITAVNQAQSVEAVQGIVW